MGTVTAVPAPQPPQVSYITYEDEMRNSYLEYAMSVIVSRALPDVRDGLKPVHRRILYAMLEGGYTSDKAYKKCARIVGDVMGKYHPHGDAAIYETLVRLVQDFKMAEPLIQGQGNFGSVDGDSAAAMRYTEARLSKLSDAAMTEDINLSTVDWRPNYDGSESEPVVLPARFPNLLVNGQTGIAVGMATNIPPHNLGEVIDVTLALIANPDLTIDQVMQLMPGPDFPTGGIIQGRNAIREAFETGRRSLTLSGVWSIETLKGKRRQPVQAIIITELPFDVNKEVLVADIAEKARPMTVDKTVRPTLIDGIDDMRDESNQKEGCRIVIELKPDANPELTINQLKKHTRVVIGFGVNAVCLTPEGQPVTLGVLAMLRYFVAFRREVITRRTEHLLEKARTNLTKQVGLFAARSQIDEVVRRIRASANKEASVVSLMAMDFACEGELAQLIHETDRGLALPETFRLSEPQARAVIDQTLAALTNLGLEGIAEKARELLVEILVFENILNEPAALEEVMCRELSEVRAKFAQPRRTRIEAAGPDDISDDDLIEQKPVVLTLTLGGYVKYSPLEAYREQSRGGKGKTGMDTKEDDVVTRTIVCTTRTTLIFFTSRGIAHTIKAHKLPMAAPNARGRPIVNFISLLPGETVATVMAQPEAQDGPSKFMMFVTDKGDVRRNAAADFESVNKGGKIAMKLEDDNGNSIARLVDVLVCTESDDLCLATRKGKVVRFPVTDIRVFSGRTATGNKGVELAREADEVIGASIIRHFEATPEEREAYLSGGSFTFKGDDGTEKSFSIDEERMAAMAAAEEFLLTVTSGGYGKRFSSHDFRISGRGTQGVVAGTFSSNTGDLVACFRVSETDGIVMVTGGGQVIRTPTSEIRKTGRSARGVRLFDLPDGQAIVDVARVPAAEEGDEEVADDAAPPPAT